MKKRLVGGQTFGLWDLLECTVTGTKESRAFTHNVSLIFLSQFSRAAETSWIAQTGRPKITAANRW